MKMKLFVFMVLLFTISCTKEEGEGGKNNIEGYVMTQEIRRGDSLVISEYPSFEDKIYIIYGDNAYYADKFVLNYDGYYVYNDLYKGKYSIFVYSDCLSCNGGMEPVFMDIELLERREDFVADTIFKIKYID